MHDDEVEVDEDLVRHAFDSGINYFDTADSYGNGRAEENLARAFCELDVRPHGPAAATR